jgi:hypothetical protein
MATKSNINMNLAFVLQSKISFIRVIKLHNVVTKKKGVGDSRYQVIADLKGTWFYDWGPFDHSLSTTEFVPMMWNGGHASQANINATIAKDSLTHISAFNEPDHEGQAEMTIAQSMPLYKDMLRIGQRMGSPACTEGQHRVWLDTFAIRAKEQNLAVDYICDHWYDWGNWLSTLDPNASATGIFNRFKAYITNLYDFHKKPIWLTEFNANVNRVPAVHEAFMALALPWLDANPNVERYAYFFGNDYPVYSSTGALNPGSVFYANHASTDANPENVVDTRPSTVSILASWNPSTILEGGRNDATFAPTFLGANIIAPSALTRGSGLSIPPTGSTNGYWGAQGWSTTTAQAGISGNDFLTFSLKSINGKSVNYHSIEKLNIRITSSGPIQYLIDYKVDNGVYRPIDTVKGPTRVTGNYQLGPIALHNVPGLQDVPPTSTVTFRITPFDATNAASSFLIGSGTTDTDPDLVITGGFSDINTIIATTTTADLSALSISSGSLLPIFAAATNSYTATVSSITSFVTITPTKANVNATIQVKVNNTAYQNVNSGSPSHTLNLNDGNNTIEVLVTGQGGTPTKTYTITVNRQSNNADLANLELNTGTLSTPVLRPFSPTFAAATTSYTATISGSSTIRVTPTRQNAFSTIHVRINNSDYVQASSGIASDALTLNFGNNIIDVRVTSQDGLTIKTYSINVLRPSINTNLSNLTISTGTLTPSFDVATISYTATVPSNTTSVTVTPTKEDASSTLLVRVNGGTWMDINSGEASAPLSTPNIAPTTNTINVRVTAQNGTLKSYTITVTKLSANATLTALTLSSGILSPTFTSATTAYAASVSNNISSITITPTSASTLATTQVRINAGAYTTVERGTASTALSLNVGSNTIDALITAQDGTTRTYTITVTRISVLPVQLVDFSAQLQANKTVAVNWTSSSEINLNRYQVQRSNNGSNFTTIGTVSAKGASNYNYTDDLNILNTLPSNVYYRLESIDNDALTSYSKIVAVAVNSSTKVTINIYPNPIKNILAAQFVATKTGNFDITITNFNGKLLIKQTTRIVAGNNSIFVNTASLPSGSYVLVVNGIDGIQKQQFIKQ